MSGLVYVAVFRGRMHLAEECGPQNYTSMTEWLIDGIASTRNNLPNPVFFLKKSVF
jgi:hypothetical protein